MATWIYEARDGSGRVVRGEREAADRNSALSILRGEGLFLTRLEPAARKRLSTKPAAPAKPLRPRVETGGPAFAPPSGASTKVRAASKPLDPPLPSSSTKLPHSKPLPGTTAPVPIVRQPFLHASGKDIATFFGQMAALLHAGTSVGAALGIMAENAGNTSLRSAARQLASSTMAGAPLAEKMGAFPALFSPLAVGIISAGERGGFLEESFVRMARYSERDYELQQSVKRETWYPKLLVVCSILIPGAIPLFLQGFGAFLAQVGPPFLIMALAFIAWKMWKFALPAWSLNPSIARPFDEIKLSIPVVGKVVRGLSTAKFCRALGALYAAGVSPGESVRLSAQACGNSALSTRALAQIPRLENGESLTECLGSIGVFNPLALQMMRVGEESGNLDGQLDKAADFLETDAETAVKQAVPVLGIVVFLCVALYIGSMIIGAYQTNYGDQMNDLINAEP